MEVCDMLDYTISDVEGREILDSRGNPTLEAEVTLDNKVTGCASVPSGASTGIFEAKELRDEDERYNGKGVRSAAYNINTDLRKSLLGKNVLNQKNLDGMMCETDGTERKTKYGANAILATSLAIANAGAKATGLPLYKYLGGICSYKLPVPMMNILNGGAHARNNLDIQEFMIMPVGACCFNEALRMGTEVYHELKGILADKGLVTAVGDEGGFAPDVGSLEETLDLLMESVNKAGYKPGKDICFALDVAASEWKSEKGKGYYHLPKSGKEYRTEELIDMYKNMIKRYPILSIEDPLDEEDWEGWKKITAELGDKVQLVGDDLFVTITERLAKGI